MGNPSAKTVCDQTSSREWNSEWLSRLTDAAVRLDCHSKSVAFLVTPHTNLNCLSIQNCLPPSSHPIHKLILGRRRDGGGGGEALGPDLGWPFQCSTAPIPVLPIGPFERRRNGRLKCKGMVKCKGINECTKRVGSCEILLT